MDLPGIEVDDEVRGALAYHLLSGPALIRYAQAAGEDLELPPSLRTADPERPQIRQILPRLVDAALSDADTGVRQAAAGIARRLGRNLAYIVLALHRGDGVNRLARADWGTTEWAEWSEIRKIWLGGGIVSGELGIETVRHANDTLQHTDSGAHLVVQRAPRPRNMALLGVARYFPPRDAPEWHALCLDFGQTSAKRALATVNGGSLKGLALLPDVPVSWQWRNDPLAGRDIPPCDVLNFAARTIADGIALAKAQGVQVVEDIAVSVAAYTDGGTLMGNGIYARMSHLAADVRTLLAERVMALSGEIQRVHIVHDGTAASALHAGTARSAVIVVGTALGVGFPPADEVGLLAVA